MNNTKYLKNKIKTTVNKVNNTPRPFKPCLKEARGYCQITTTNDNFFCFFNCTPLAADYHRPMKRRELMQQGLTLVGQTLGHLPQTLQPLVSSPLASVFCGAVDTNDLAGFQLQHGHKDVIFFFTATHEHGR